MRQQVITEFSFINILRSEETKAVLELLSEMGRVPFTILDENAQPLARISGNGTRENPHSLQESIAAQAPAPEERKPSEETDDPLIQEILFQDYRVGEIHGRMLHASDPEKARQSLQLASKWIHDKIENEYNLNSLSAEILNNYEELNLLYEFSQEIISVFDAREICEIVLRKALSVIGAEKASIFLWDSHLKKLRMMANVGLAGKVENDLVLGADEGICGYVFQTGKALLVEDLENLPKEIVPGEGNYRTESFLSVPLLVSPMKVKGKIIGVINLTDKPSSRSYHAADLKLLSAISSQATLSVLNSTLIQDLKENERIQKEMEIAETVQKNLLPRRAPNIPGIELVGRCIPAKEVGGDYYDFFPNRKGEVAFVVADVSGHSISSGIMMAITRGLLQSEAVHEKSPGKLLYDINRSLYSDLVSSELFITMAYFSYNAQTGRLAFANGGHNPPVLLRVSSDEPELLDAEGMAIGFLEEVDFEEKFYELASGDLLVLYTDGVVESENESQEQFGMDRFLQHLRTVRQNSAGDILESLYQAVGSHIGGKDPHTSQQDDITMVILKIL